MRLTLALFHRAVFLLKIMGVCTVFMKPSGSLQPDEPLQLIVKVLRARLIEALRRRSALWEKTASTAQHKHHRDDIYHSHRADVSDG